MHRCRMRPPASTGPASATRPKGRACRRSRGRLVGSGRRYVGWSDHTQKIDATAIRAHDAKFHLAYLDAFSTARQASELLHQQAADGVVFLVGKCSAEVVIEVGDGRERAYREFTLAFPPYRLIVLHVVLIVDLADDLLDDILDGHQAAHSAVLIDDHGDVIVAAAKLLEQNAETFALL